GRREVPIAPPAHDGLAALKASLLPPDSSYVWQATDGGVFAPASVMKRARVAWKKAKLAEIGLHEARHRGQHVDRQRLVGQGRERADRSCQMDGYGFLWTVIP